VATPNIGSPNHASFRGFSSALHTGIGFSSGQGRAPHTRTVGSRDSLAVIKKIPSL